MKKLTIFLFIALLLLALIGCTQTPQSEPEQDKQSVEQTQPNDQQTEQAETKPVQNPQTDPEQKPLTLTQDNIYEIVSPALKACAQAVSGYPFSDKETDDEGYIKYFNIIEDRSGYTKSTQFKTIAELKQYFSTYLAPELYTWIDQAETDQELVELSDGLYQCIGGHGYQSFYPQSLTLVKQDGDVYHIAVAYLSGGDWSENAPSIPWGIFQGIIENDHFKIISRPEYTDKEFNFTPSSNEELFPGNYGKRRP